MKVSDEYGVKQNDSAIFQLFNSKKYGGKDLMFKDSTIKLGDVSQKTYQKLLGDLYMKDLEALDDCVSPTAGSSDNKPYSFLVSVVFMFVALVLSWTVWNRKPALIYFCGCSVFFFTVN